MPGGIVLGAFQKASSVSTVPEPTESGRFENYDFAMFLGGGFRIARPRFLVLPMAP
jgi:hypothetical protein